MSDHFVRKAIALVAVGALPLGGSGPADAATYSYQSWGQTSGNTAGVRFGPNGDWFEAWDNVNDGHTAIVRFNYQDADDDWQQIGQVKDGYAGFVHDVYEKIDGNPGYIYFQVCDRFGCSNPSWYRTWGS